MRAKAPLDVDLEDKLLYGLTPVHLGYLVLALLGAFALWSSPWAPAAVRTVTSVVVVIAGATVAWGRWRGRAIDGWLIDVALFALRTYRVVWSERWVGILKRRSPASSAGPSGGP
jgi:hypothetical protein